MRTKKQLLLVDIKVRQRKRQDSRFVKGKIVELVAELIRQRVPASCWAKPPSAHMHACTQHTYFKYKFKGVELRRPFLGTWIFLLQGTMARRHFVIRSEALGYLRPHRRKKGEKKKEK